MSDHKDCDCRACRARKVLGDLNVAIADHQAAAARLNATNARSVSNEADAELWINLMDRVARGLGSCAAAMNAAMDQFEAAKGRVE